MAPIPRREDTLARPRSRKGNGRPAVTHGTMRPVTPIDPDPNWHKSARLIFDGALASGQADFYQTSDIAVLHSLCEILSRALYSDRLSGQLLATIYSALDSLLLTEGDRRKARLELQRVIEGEDDESVIAIADYKKSLGVAKA